MSIEELPDTLTHGKGFTMTFLRNDTYITRSHISGAPDADGFYVPPHWHDTHDEIFCVRKGQVEVRIGSSVRMYGPEDGEVKIPKGVVHSLKAYKGVECVVDERTDPMDGEKELFFRNLLGQGTHTPNLFEIMHIFYYGDCWPAFPGHFVWLERAFVTVIGGYIAPMLGYTRKYHTLKKL